MAVETTNNKGWIARAFASGVIRAFAYHVTAIYILPLGLPLLSAYLAHAEGLPWSVILLFAGVMFASVSTGLLRFEQWRDRGRIREKLEFSNILVGKNMNGAGLVIGVGLVSKAAIPIEIEYAKIHSRIDGRVPKVTAFEKTKFTVPALGNAFFYDHPIDIDKGPSLGTLEGFAEFHIKYGKFKNLKYDLLVKKRVIIKFDVNGVLEHGAWHDAP